MMCPSPGDPIPRCGHPLGIRSSDVAPQDCYDEHVCEVNLTVWPPPPPGDQILRCGPSRGIRSYNVAPHPRGIELSVVAPAVGSTATPRDRSNIL